MFMAVGQESARGAGGRRFGAGSSRRTWGRRDILDRPCPAAFTPGFRKGRYTPEPAGETPGFNKSFNAARDMTTNHEP